MQFHKAYESITCQFVQQNNMRALRDTLGAGSLTINRFRMTAERSLGQFSLISREKAFPCAQFDNSARRIIAHNFDCILIAR